MYIIYITMFLPQSFNNHSFGSLLIKFVLLLIEKQQVGQHDCHILVFLTHFFTHDR